MNTDVQIPEQTRPEVGTGQKSQLFALFLVVFISLLGFGIVVPVFPFFGKLVGATPQQITLAMAAYSLGQFIGAPFWGQLSDKYGRRPILLWSCLASVVAYVVMAHADDIWTLGFSRLLGGMMAGNIAAAFAYIGDVTDDESRPRAMGLLGAAFGMGFIFGPAIGGLIAGSETNAQGFLYIGYASAAATLIAAICTFAFVQESLTQERRAAVAQNGLPSAFTSLSIMKAKPIILWLVVLSLFVIGAAALFETTFAFLVSDRFQWGPREIGLGFAVIGGVAAITQAMLVGPVVRMFGEAQVMCGSIILYAIGIGSIGYVNSVFPLLIAMATTALGVGLFSPAYQSYASAQSNDSDRGLVMGVTQAAGSLGRVVGPAASGAIYMHVGQSAPFYWGGAVMLLSFFLAIYTVTRHSRRPTTV